MANCNYETLHRDATLFSVASYYQIRIVVVNSFFIKFFRNKNSPDFKRNRDCFMFCRNTFILNNGITDKNPIIFLPVIYAPGYIPDLFSSHRHLHTSPISECWFLRL